MANDSASILWRVGMEEKGCFAKSHPHKNFGGGGAEKNTNFVCARRTPQNELDIRIFVSAGSFFYSYRTGRAPDFPCAVFLPRARQGFVYFDGPEGVLTARTYFGRFGTEEKGCFAKAHPPKHIWGEGGGRRGRTNNVLFVQG